MSAHVYTLQISLLCDNKGLTYLILFQFNSIQSLDLSVWSVHVLAVPAWVHTDMQVPLTEGSEQSPLQSCNEAVPRHSPSDSRDGPQLHSNLDFRMRADRWMDGK